MYVLSGVDEKNSNSSYALISILCAHLYEQIYEQIMITTHLLQACETKLRCYFSFVMFVFVLVVVVYVRKYT